jgi:hypothetical protein
MGQNGPSAEQMQAGSKRDVREIRANRERPVRIGGGMTESKTQLIQVPAAQRNLRTYAFIFTARKFLEAAQIVVAYETQQEESKWHPVGKYLACHSIELLRRS